MIFPDVTVLKLLGKGLGLFTLQAYVAGKDVLLGVNVNEYEAPEQTDAGFDIETVGNGLILIVI